jgi:superfamily II DNA helicase RecQ
MKDQVDAANANGLRAAFLNSSQEMPSERSEVVRALRAGAAGPALYFARAFRAGGLRGFSQDLPHVLCGHR